MSLELSEWVPSNTYPYLAKYRFEMDATQLRG